VPYSLPAFPLPAGMISGPPLVVLDACILMSSVLRPLMLDLASRGAYAPVWSTRIGAEWTRNAARIWQCDIALVQADWQAMQLRFPAADAGEVAAYEAGLRYSDPKDRHVIAAGLAQRARHPGPQLRAAAVLTWNLKDFNRPEMRRMGMDAYGPDRLLSHWWQEDPVLLGESLHQTLAQLVANGRAPEPLERTLQRERLHRLRALVTQAG